MRLRISHGLLLLLVSTVAWGCVTSNVTRLNNTERSPLQKEDVTIYLEEKSIEGDYEEMAVINIEATANLTDESDVYERARKEAAEILKNLGADIDTSVTKRTNYIIAGKDPGPSKMRKAMKYKNEGKDLRILKEEEFLKMLK